MNSCYKKDEAYCRGTRQDVFAIVPSGVRRVLEIGCGAGRFRENFPDEVEYWGWNLYQRLHGKRLD